MTADNYWSPHISAVRHYNDTYFFSSSSFAFTAVSIS